MATIPLGDARNRLSEVVVQVQTTHERVVITRHGRPAAVLVAPDDLTALEETLDLLSTPGEAEAVREGVADAASGRFADADEIRRRYQR
ncbi:type II toxin-antitoxin system Phd/YefM family antitoxin [Saccharopolyspora rosea]|uniref:type II toxin-antitoxin system Phd/YefM family antitoxin n=1 Tax=Saccharopolyspora rosea TaxID=524884 RepID=UPI0021DA1A5F|nr:type II toxin-antitoxin system Phd/YefM family antitoxin [Saccharopolyspora rosea]